jgi:hypothetical protein
MHILLKVLILPIDKQDMALPDSGGRANNTCDLLPINSRQPFKKTPLLPSLSCTVIGRYFFTTEWRHTRTTRIMNMNIRLRRSSNYQNEDRVNTN